MMTQAFIAVAAAHEKAYADKPPRNVGEALDAEVWALRRMAPGPFRWILPADLWRLFLHSHTALRYLLTLMNLIFHHNYLPGSWSRATIVAIFKQKGDIAILPLGGQSPFSKLSTSFSPLY